MIRFRLLATILIALVAARAARAGDVLTHASGERMWVAKVSSAPNPGTGPTTTTSILVREIGSAQRWNTLIVLPTRATGLAARSSQLAVLLTGSEWMNVWGPAQSASGSALPGKGRIRALADDGDSLWAIGDVNGGLTIAAAATQASTQPAATTGPAALPTTMVLFQQQAGVWKPIAELPDDPSILPGADTSLAVENGKPIVAIQSATDAIQLLQLSENHTWKDLATLHTPNNEKPDDFKLINTSAGIALWVAHGKTPGHLFPNPLQSPNSIPLKWVGEHPPESLPDITFAGGYIRLVGLNAGNLYEQRYDSAGQPIDSSAALQVPNQISNKQLQLWFDVALCFALAFTVGATMHRRMIIQRTGVPTQMPMPAPFIPRLSAGVVDLLPIIITAAVIAFRSGGDMDESLIRIQQIPQLIALGIAVAFYLLHTTLCEVFTGRTLGKWIFGLRVVSIDSTAPNRTQYLIRNILRIIDLCWFPLLLVIISPFRQRSADLAAGTIVVQPNEKGEVEKQRKVEEYDEDE